MPKETSKPVIFKEGMEFLCFEEKGLAVEGLLGLNGNGKAIPRAACDGPWGLRAHE